MKHNVLIFNGFLISGIVIAFLLMSNEGETDPVQSISPEISQKDITDIGRNHPLKDSNGTEETQKELKDTNSLLPLKLDLRLAGTVRVGKEYTYALIVDEKQGGQRLYSVGESIKGVKLLKIDKEDVVVEKDGRVYVLRITGGSYTEVTHSEVLSGHGPPSIGVSEELHLFVSIVTDSGPPSIGVSEELPAFEPIVLEPNPPAFASLDSEKGLPDR